jgi:hypothetical protein
MLLSSRVRQRLRTILVCCVLEFGAVIGLPMRPGKIEELIHAMNQPQIVHTTPDEHDTGDDDEPRRDGSVTDGEPA